MPRPPVSSLPLHCKPVGGGIDLAAVSELPVENEGLRAEWNDSARWCWDGSMYERVPAAETIEVTRLSDADIDMMYEAGTVRPLDANEQPRQTCRVFCVPEWSKDPPRRRRVAHPVVVNEVCDRETLRQLRLPLRAEIRYAIHDGDWVAILDAASFFDQFPLSPDVSRYFCFADRHGKLWALASLAMGQRQSTEVATALMKVLCSFETGVRIDIATDNLRFIGRSKTEVADAVQTFSFHGRTPWV